MANNMQVTEQGGFVGGIKAAAESGGLPAAIPPLTAPESESMAVSAGTAVAPSDIRVNYYQDINKVIRNLQAAVSSL